MEQILNNFKTMFTLDSIKQTFIGRTITFYISLGVALVTLIMSIIYVAIYNGTPQMDWLVFVLPLVASILFVLLALAKYEKIGLMILGTVIFAMALVFGINGYSIINEWAINFAINQEFTPEFITYAVFVAIYLVLFILCNVCVWTKMSKAVEANDKGEIA